MRFLVIVLKISVAVFSIGPEFTVVALRKRYRQFYGIFFSFYAESVAQNTKLRPKTSGGLEIRNRCLKGREILVVRFHEPNMARPALKFI